MTLRLRAELAVITMVAILASGGCAVARARRPVGGVEDPARHDTSTYERTVRELNATTTTRGGAS